MKKTSLLLVLGLALVLASAAVPKANAGVIVGVGIRGSLCWALCGLRARASLFARLCSTGAGLLQALVSATLCCPTRLLPLSAVTQHELEGRAVRGASARR